MVNNIANVNLAAAAIRRQDIVGERGRRLLESCIEVAPADLLLPEIVVDLAHILIVVLVRGRTNVSQLPPGAARNRDVLEQLFCNVAEARLWDLIINEWRAGDRIFQLNPRQQTREIARTLGGGGDKTGLALAALAIRVPWYVPK
jgi:hypothetical protein